MEFYNVFDASDILPAVKTTRPFPYVYSKSEPCFKNEIDQECSICFEEYKEDLSKEICILPCYHLFHKQCYDNHIKSKFTDYLHSLQEGTWPEQPWPCNCPFNCSGQVKGDMQTCLQSYCKQIKKEVHVLPRLLFSYHELIQMKRGVKLVIYFNLPRVLRYYELKQHDTTFSFIRYLDQFYESHPIDSVYSTILEKQFENIRLSHTYIERIKKAGFFVTVYATLKSFGFSDNDIIYGAGAVIVMLIDMLVIFAEASNPSILRQPQSRSFSERWYNLMYGGKRHTKSPRRHTKTKSKKRK